MALNEEEASKRAENISAIKNETKGFYFKFVKLNYSAEDDINKQHWKNGFDEIVRRLSNYTDKVKAEDFKKAMFETIDSAKTIYQLGDFKRYPIDKYKFQELSKEKIDNDIKHFISNMVDRFYNSSVATECFNY